MHIQFKNCLVYNFILVLNFMAKKVSRVIEDLIPLMRRITAPSNTVIDRQSTSSDQGLSFQAAVNAFIKTTTEENITLPVTNSDTHRALFIALAYGNLPPQRMQKFNDDVVMSRIHQDSVPVYYSRTKPAMNFDYHVAWTEVLEYFKMCHDLTKGFGYYLYPAKNDGISKKSLLSRFADYASGEENCFPKTGSPNQFPGPGLIIAGLQSHVFPKDFVRQELGLEFNRTNLKNPYYAVHYAFRDLIVEVEKELNETIFGFFRGVIVISNPNMKIDGKRYAFIGFNDHWENPEQKMCYLVPYKYARDFILNPDEALRKGSPCDPKQIDTKKFESEILNLNWISVLGGFDKALPVEPRQGDFYPKCIFTNKQGERVIQDLLAHEVNLSSTTETRDTIYGREKGHMHRTHMFEGYWREMPISNLEPFKLAHDEIGTCARRAMAAQYLFMESLRLYMLGYNGNLDSNYDLILENPDRTLSQLIDWHNSTKVSYPEKPILIPVPRLTMSGLDPQLIEEFGAADSGPPFIYRRQGPISIPSSPLNDLTSIGQQEARRGWMEFLGPIIEAGKNLVFMPRVIAQSLIKDTLGINMKMTNK